MYAWQRRSKKPLLPPKPTDFDDVLKLTEETKRRVLEEEEKENALPRLENASSSFEKEEDGRVVNGEEEEKEEDQEKCEEEMGWLAMKTKATEAFARLEFKRREMVRESVGEFADRRRKDERRRRRKKKRSSVADGESIAGFVESEREENSLGNRSRVRRRRRGLAQRQLSESGSFVCSKGV